MAEKRVCPDCGKEVALVNAGGVHRDILCVECNREMTYESHIDHDYIGHEIDDSYRLVKGGDA